MAPPTAVTNTNTAPATPPVDPKKAPEKKDEKKAAPKPPKTTVTYEKADDKFVLRPFFNWGLGKVGGPNGTLFSIDSNPANEHGDWNIYRLGVDGEFRVARMFKDRASLLLGATLSADFHRGGQNTGGSYLNAVEVGPSITLDWTNAYKPSWKVIGPNRVTLQGGLIAGKGNTTAGDNFSLDETSGAGGFLRGAIDLIGVRLTPSGTTLNVGAWFETGVIPDARGPANYPYYAGGLGISVPIRWPGSTKKVTTEICTTSEMALEDLKRDLPIMRQAVGEAYADYTTLSDVLKSKGYDSDTVRKYLRAGRIEQLKAQETARVEAEGQKAGKKADEIKKDVAAALKAKEKDFLTTAEVDYPDGYDYYNVKLPKQANIPDPLPTDCNAIEDLRKQLEDEKRGLDKAAQVIYDKMHFMLMLLGVPKGSSTTVVKLIRSVVNIRNVNFITNAPWSTDDPATKKIKIKNKKATIEFLNGLVDTYLKSKTPDADGNREVTPMAQMMEDFSSIFPSSYKQDGTTKTNPALEAIADVAGAFRSPDMKGFRIYIIGNTDSRGPDDYNQRLSLRRAQAIRNALVLNGVNPDMLVPIGRGENNQVYYFDQKGGKDPHAVKKAEIKELAANGIKGKALNDEIFGRQTTNRRVEVLVCAPNSDDAVCQALEKEVGPATPTDATNPPPPVQNIDVEKKKVTKKVNPPPPPPPPPEKTPPPPPPPPPPAPDIK